MAVISAPQSSITAWLSSTTRRLVMPAVSASVSRSRIIGIDTTQLANTTPANPPPPADCGVHRDEPPVLRAEQRLQHTAGRRHAGVEEHREHHQRGPAPQQLQ